MKIRRSVLPRRNGDFICFLFVITLVTLAFFFEITVVLPEFYDTGSLMYFLTLFVGFFLLFNIKTNMIACFLVDTSIQAVILQPPVESKERKWRYCEDCRVTTPPRSWHCQRCNTCILKRDHHCIFTGCCIGHNNHRYFLYFIFYLSLGACYATIYNSIYLWWMHADLYANKHTFLKMVCPIFFLVTDFSWKAYSLFVYELILVAGSCAIVLTVFSVSNILRGAVSYDRLSNKYNLGSWRLNLQTVLGKRMYLTWLSPFVRSDLPDDGTQWDGITTHTEKNR